MKKAVHVVIVSFLLLLSFNFNVSADSTDIERWEVKKDLPISRSYPQVAVADNTIYLIGGSSSGYTGYSNDVYAYDSNNDSWIKKTPMPTARYGAGITVIDNLIYVIGGRGGSTLVEVYNPETDSWTTKSSLPEGRIYTSAITVDNKIYVIGGYNSSNSNVGTNFEYDPANN